MIDDIAALYGPARAAGIRIPPTTAYKRALYPHWYVFVVMQLERPMPTPDTHWRNAEIIASIPSPKILRITNQALVALGFV